MPTARYERDMIGYGPRRPAADWPDGAKIAVQFVLNYEEGGESCLLHGDDASEGFLSDIPGAAPWLGERHWNMESLYEYGARAGFWRVHRLFTGAGVPVTVYGVASALARSPEQVEAMTDAGWEIASHGLKWIDHRDMPEADEAAQIAEAIRLHTEVVGTPPRGWYTGRCSMNTVRLAAETGAFEYISDAYDDDLPHWLRIGGRDQLIIPYTLEANDMRFAATPGWVTGQDFAQYLIDAFDTLYAEGEAGLPAMMSVGLHCRLIGRPGKIAGLKRFLDHIAAHQGVWCPTRLEIARHWAQAHPPRPVARPSEMTRDAFVETFGGVFEGSAWVPERAYELELGPAHDTPAGLHNALARMFRSASEAERLGVLCAQPDPAEMLAASLTDTDHAQLVEPIKAHKAKHGFPFIIAAQDPDASIIHAELERRIANDTETEFVEACLQVERIARRRLEGML
jgi:chitin deacetylase